MPVPDRPVDGAPTATDWGQEIHDRVFAPAGVECHGAGVTVTTTVTQIPLDTADQDPGGFLDAAGDRLVIPTDREGIYDVICRLDVTSGVDGDGVRGYVRRNGGEITRGYEDSETGAQSILTMVTNAGFVAGDVVTVHAKKKGSGANPTVLVSRLIILRRGQEIGA